MIKEQTIQGTFQIRHFGEYCQIVCVQCGSTIELVKEQPDEEGSKKK